METIRDSAISGIFYPNDEHALKNDIVAYLSRSQSTANKAPKFLIVPHAGYIYSGKTAGEGYAEIKSGSYSHAIILGPSHRHYFKGVTQTGDSAWKTPLGLAPVVPLEHPRINTNSGFHTNEHCLEIQVPFVQYLLPQAGISPLLVSGPLSIAEECADVLSAFDSQDTLWIISSDFSHVGPNFSYSPENYGFQNGDAIDHQAIEIIVKNDIEGFRQFIQKHDATICGALPILISMILIEKLNWGHFSYKAYDSSGRQTRDVNSVGYAALYC